MGKCQTEGNKRWDSKVGATDDGKIFIGPEQSGNFTGKHEKSHKDLHGKCREKNSGNHKIWFVVPENGHLYVGVFISDTKMEGLRFNIGDIGKFKAPPFDGGDEDWVAVKTT